MALRITLQQTPQRQTNDIQRQVQRVATATTGAPASSGVLIKGLRFTAAATQQVAHTLKQAPAGWALQNIYASSTSYAPILARTSTGKDESRLITFYSYGTFTADVWFF